MVSTVIGRLIAERPLGRERDVYCGQPLRPRSVLDSLPHPLTEALLSPYLSGIAPHVPALGKPILPISLPAYLDRPIFTPKSPSISTLWRLCWPVATSHSFPVPIAIHLVDAETKHPIRKDVDDMQCTPRKTAGEWSPQDGVRQWPR